LQFLTLPSSAFVDRPPECKDILLTCIDLKPAFVDLQQIRLGKPLTQQLIDQITGLRYRIFENGVITVNWDTHNAKDFLAQNVISAALGEEPQKFQY
jgi:hypothetical protein